MIKRNLLLLAVLLVLVSVGGVVHAQPKHKPRPKTAAVPKLTATGLLYFGGDGQGIQTCLLKTPTGIVEINVTSKTRVVGFPEDNSAWNLGSEWRVTYHKSKDAALGLEADTVTFTRNSNPAIAAAETVARDYLTALSPDNNDFEKAYKNLSQAARRNMSIDDFKGMYESVEFDTKTIKVCSHTEEKVVLLVTYFGDNWDIAQCVEVIQTGGKSSINRLFELEQNVPKAETVCRKQ